MDEHSTIWEPISGIDTPCAGLSFTFESSSKIKVSMHFARVVEGPTLDLELIFSGALALRWVDECHGSIFHPTCGPLPKCRGERWSDWTFPLLLVRESKWLATYQSIPELPGSAGRQHFALVCMNDLLDIAALPEVGARWVEPT